MSLICRCDLGCLGAGAFCQCPASWERIRLYIARQGKDPNSKFEVWLLLHHPIVKKSCQTALNQGPSARMYKWYLLFAMCLNWTRDDLAFSMDDLVSSWHPEKVRAYNAFSIWWDYSQEESCNNHYSLDACVCFKTNHYQRIRVSVIGIILIQQNSS